MKANYQRITSLTGSAVLSAASPYFVTKFNLSVLVVFVLTMVLPSWCGNGLAVEDPASQQAFSSPEQAKRLDAMKHKGPAASLTIVPVMLVGRPFDRMTDALGVLLEQQGLRSIELGRTPFTGGVKAEMRALCGSLASFLRTNAIATDYALYAEFNGPSLDEIRAVVLEKSGEVVWMDHQTTRDNAFQALGTQREPMTLLTFLTERLRPQFSLNDETARSGSHKLQDRFNAQSGYGSAEETGKLMPARVKAMKQSRQQATLTVLGVRMEGAVNVASASDLAKRINKTKLFQKAEPAKKPILLEASLGSGDQAKYLWAIAREFQAYIKKNPPEADYALYADYLFNRQDWRQGGVQFVVCDRQGEWVMAELTNSGHEDYQRVKPISAEGCDTLLVERLQGFLLK